MFGFRGGVGGSGRATGKHLERKYNCRAQAACDWDCITSGLSRGIDGGGCIRYSSNRSRRNSMRVQILITFESSQFSPTPL